MPYIKQKHREKYDVLVDQLAEHVHKLMNDESMRGHLNYIICTLMLKSHRKPRTYDSFNHITGVLENAKLEIYRRYASVYEDGAIERNGDLDDPEPDPRYWILDTK